jgi:CRP-like cAMP-binding protein
MNTAIAQGNTELVALGRADFNDLCEQHPTIQRTFCVMQGKQDADGRHYIECSHEELARYVAASRQSTSVELIKLEKAGIIRSAYAKIYVLDTQALDDSSHQLTSYEPIAPLYEPN